MVLSHSLWRERFGADPRAIGRKVLLDGAPHTVVGVMSAGREFPPDTQLWLPHDFREEAENRGNRGWAAVGRLADGIDRDDAGADLAGIAAALAVEYPEANAGWSVTLMPLLDDYFGAEIFTIFTVLMIAVGFVVLIACANTASLLLARGVGREKEMSLRVALGAGRGRVLRQLLSENLLLALAGGGLGLALSPLFVRGLLAIAPADTPRLDNIGISSPVLAYTLGLTLVTALAFGLAPALQASKPDLNDALKDAGHRGGGGRRHRLLRGLVAAEVALALALMALGLLMTRSIQSLLREDPGVTTADKLTARLSLSESQYPDDVDQKAFYAAVMARLEQLPGVVAAGAVQTLPFSGRNAWRRFQVEGRPPEDGEDARSVGYLIVAGRYFEAMGIRTLRGRALADEDMRDGAATVVVNRTLAETYFPDVDPVGRRLRFGTVSSAEENPWLTVVGVVSDVRHSGVDDPPRAEVYIPYAQSPRLGMSLVARTVGEPAAVAPALRSAIRDIDPNQPIYDVATLDRVLADDNAADRAVAEILAVLALGALVLAAIGIYGVVAFAVSERRYEIGIRRAIGAASRDIVLLTLRQVAVPVAVGLVAGIAIALALGRVLGGVLFGVTAGDPVTYAAAFAALVGAALVAALVPARRASRLDPLIVLRDGG